MRYKAVIFDLDGTLLDTIEDLADSVNYVMEKYGWPTYSYATVRGFLGNGNQRLLELTVPDGGDNPLFDEAYAAFRARYLDNCEVKTRLYDGIGEVLDQLHGAGCPMACVSNKNDDAVKKLREKYFPAVGIAIGVTPSRQRKPAPDEVEAALMELGLGKDEAVYVGDSEVDFATAHNSGLDFVGCAWGFRGREKLEALGAKRIADRPSDIIGLLD